MFTTVTHKHTHNITITYFPSDYGKVNKIENKHPNTKAMLGIIISKLVTRSMPSVDPILIVITELKERLN